jgi:hypothetical protein
MAVRTGGSFAGAWLAGVVLGAVNGTAVLSLGVLLLPLLLASVLLILWNGPMLIAGAGFLAGAGLVWTVLFLRVALTCGGPLDPDTSTCISGDLGGWIISSVAIFALGLLFSAVAVAERR